MSDVGEAVPVQHRSRWRRVVRVLAVVAVVLALALAVVWTQRKPIAGGFVARELARYGVPARYTLKEVGFRRQRLTNVVIGDPNDPDLTADRIDVYTDVKFGGASVTGISVGQAFLKAKVAGGQVSLGAIDKLLPKPSGKPFALPALDTRIERLRVRLATDYGQVGIRVTGSGRLNDGFSGRVAAFSYRLSSGDCRVSRLGAVMAVQIRRGAPTINGPVNANLLTCAKDSPLLQSPGGRASATLNDRLDRWTGKVEQFGAAAASMGPGMAYSIEKPYGSLTFAGDAERTTGTLDMVTNRFEAPRFAGREAKLRARYAAGAAGFELNSDVRGTHIALDAATLRQVARYASTGRGTPVGPLAARLASAAGAFGKDFAARARIEAKVAGDAYGVRVGDAVLQSESGGRVTIDGAPLKFGGLEIGGQIETGGGGLPEAVIALSQQPNGAIAGRATVQSYEALGTKLAVTPVSFVASGGGVTRVTTTATLSGPLADGRVDGLKVPIDARWRGSALALNPGCTPLAWQRVAVAGLALDPARLNVCARRAALVTLDNGRLGGGARMGPSRLTGRLGGTPLSLAAAGSELELDRQGFALTGVAARIGSGTSVTRLDAERLDGRATSGGIGGRFSGASGVIGQVPLQLSGGAGEWGLVGGRLTLAGKLAVADMQAPNKACPLIGSDLAPPSPRFCPLVSNDVRLTLLGGKIDAGGTLVTPGAGVKVADVSIRHDLGKGAGAAALVVPGITFREDGLHPELVTPLTLGVIASVNGTVSGRGDIAWTPRGVTSTGKFSTDPIDLAAAFGPVSGLATEVEFTDLLNMVTAPGQTASIAVANPGVPFENGVIRYHLLAGQKVAIEGGRWPFAGGEMLLEPTVLDFGAEGERRMTFRVTGVEVAQFLQQFDFKNLNATGTIDGVLPMIFDAKGGRIENGELVARGGGKIEYVGEVTQEDVGVWGNMAFQALRDLNYRSMRLDVSGPLEGEMVTQIRFAGVSQGANVKRNFLSQFLIGRLARLPLVFNVTVRAPFRQLIDSVQGYYDPSRLIQRNLPALIEEQRRQQGLPPTPTPIQPSESEKVR